MKNIWTTLVAFLFWIIAAGAQKINLDWPKIEEETMNHFQAILRFNTADPTGNEKLAVDYLKSVLEREGIEVKIFSLEPNHPNLVARLKGNGKKKPLLVMGHIDVVSVDSSKWVHPPFSATRADGYVYGRGSLDDKPNVVTNLMVMLLLKRMKVPLDRDLIFLAEAGEEGNTTIGMDFMVKQHYNEIDAEYCFAEGGGISRSNGKIRFGAVATTEKVPNTVRVVARGISGHGSVPLQSNSIVHLSQALVKVSSWQPPMRLNETTKAFFERLSAISTPEEAARFKVLIDKKDNNDVQQYFAANEPRFYSMLHTSISPNIIKGGYRRNVIPSEAEATLDIRALPDEDMTQFLNEVRKVINDDKIEIVTTPAARTPASPSNINTEGFKVIEAAIKNVYETITLPSMLTGATDMSFLRSKGVQCYGIGPMTDTEDGPKGFGAHSDQERILEASLQKFVRFKWEIVTNMILAQK